MRTERRVVFLVLVCCLALDTSKAWLFDIPPKYVDNTEVSKRISSVSQEIVTH